IATVFAEAQPLRPSEWAAWRNENALPELSAGLRQTAATLHLLEQVSRHLSPQSSPAAQEVARIDWGRLGRATRPTGRTDGGRGVTLDPRDGLSS
ncbi:MAG: hypothetical protein PF636_09605, partial [Actinomycetota bacterium]|nr:hypothetical protein [Actinomycetota bacterium]